MVETKKNVSKNVKKNIEKDEWDTWEELEINKARKRIKCILWWFGGRRLLSRVPAIMVVMFLIANVIYPVCTWEQVLEEWIEIVVMFWLSFMLYSITLYDEYKLKRLYKQINDWTINIKQTEIIKFKHYNRDRLDRNLLDRLRNDSWYRIITSDWINKYKSDRFPYVLWAGNVQDYVINDVIGNQRREGREGKDYLIIKWKNYRLWDEITVYVDSGKKRNYYMVVWL